MDDPAQGLSSPAKAINNVEVVIDYGQPFRFRFADPILIESAIVKPMLASEVDPPPVPAYAVLGSMHVHYNDGTTGRAVLYLPWGCWQHEPNHYRKSDLSLLRDECRRLIQASDPTAAILNDASF